MRIQTQIPYAAHIALELKACHIKINKIASCALDMEKSEHKQWAIRAIKDTQDDVTRINVMLVAYPSITALMCKPANSMGYISELVKADFKNF
jgi:hypothetical protein